jgi:hypothetical protein
MTPRIGQCYKKSADFVLSNPDWVLVHGTVEGSTEEGNIQPFAHAWVKRGTEVFDIDNNKHWDFTDWSMYAFEEKIYTSVELRKLVLAFHHSGPWTDEEYDEALRR